jgi:hypothetical protein
MKQRAEEMPAMMAVIHHQGSSSSSSSHTEHCSCAIIHSCCVETPEMLEQCAVWLLSLVSD